MMKMD